MKSIKTRKIVCLSLGLISALAVGAVGFLASNNSFKLMTKAEETTYKMTITKESAFDSGTGKVSATTDLGNTKVFSSSRFEARNGTEDYNNCLCFYHVEDGLGGYIANDTAIESIKSVKIYSYTPADPTPSTLTTQKFNVYYGYEQILVDHSNSAHVTISNGYYAFESGYEPSFIAIETINHDVYDSCVSKIEIEFACEPVVGNIVEKEGPAYQYDYVGKEFTYTATGNKVAYNITEAAPWQRINVNKVTEIKAGASTPNAGYTPTLTIADGVASYKGYYNGGMLLPFAQSEAEGRNIISFKMKMGAWEWGGPCVYFKLYKGSTEPAATIQLYRNDGFNNYWAKGGKIYNSAGVEIVSNADLGNTTDFFTFEIDVSSIGGSNTLTAISFWNGWNSFDDGYTKAPTTAIKDVVLKSTYCGCPTSTPVEYSNGYGYGTRCSTCGHIYTNLVNSLVKAIPSGKSDSIFTYETGVTFDGREECLKTTTTEYTNSSEMGWATNYKLYYKNLVKNARAAGKPIIKMNVYVQASQYDNIRFGWGVGNNKSAAQADHYNNPTLLTGASNVVDDSQLLNEDGSATTAGQRLPANQWRLIVLDVSGDYYASSDVNDLYIIGNFDAGSSHNRYPISTYISNIRCEAKA